MFTVLVKAKSNTWPTTIWAGSWSSSSPPFVPSSSTTLSSVKSSVSPGSLKLSAFGVLSSSTGGSLFVSFIFLFEKVLLLASSFDPSLSLYLIDNSAEFESEFHTTLQDLANLLKTRHFGISQDGIIMQPDKDTVHLDSWDMCPTGYVESEEDGYCGKFV